MADISKINAVALANIAKLDAVLAANLAKVNGLVFSTAPGFVGLLDETYGSGAAAAYSTRRLASATTVLMRVRRDTGTGGTGDDDGADVAYDSNNELSLDSAISNVSLNVTATTLGEFINVGTVAGTTYSNPDSLTGTASCHVTKWYDQAASNDVPQAVYTSQPELHDGTVNTDIHNLNGKPTVQFGGHTLYLSTASGISGLAQSWFFVGDAEINSASNSFVGCGRQATGESRNFTSEYYMRFTTSTQNFSGYAETNVQRLHAVVCPGTISNISAYDWYRDGVQLTPTSPSTTAVNAITTNVAIGIGTKANSGTNFFGNIQEAILWNSDQDTDRSDIEVNVNNHFAIGNFPNPTSGLLFDYPDAAAAYSVRQLANTAPLSMRVRRDTAGGTGDDDEADVLFDFTLTDPTISLDSRINNASTGVASTTLGEFLNATGYTDVDSLGTVADGFCDTWYDQSGNGNNAEQTGFSAQPQIFDSASPTDLITENGKPAVYYAGNKTLSHGLPTNAGYSTNHGLFAVGRIVTTNNYAVWFGAGNNADSTNGISLNSKLATNNWGTYAGTPQPANSSLNDSSQHLCVMHRASAGSGVFRLDGSTDGTYTGTSGTTSATIGHANTKDNIQEIVFYDTEPSSSDITGIETDINTYFSIY